MKNEKEAGQKTYNTRDSLVVTDPTTSPALTGLSMGERTGSRVFHPSRQEKFSGFASRCLSFPDGRLTSSSLTLLSRLGRISILARSNIRLQPAAAIVLRENQDISNPVPRMFPKVLSTRWQQRQQHKPNLETKFPSALLGHLTVSFHFRVTAV
ncbi:hypothetical protein GGR50DRAFT_521722 [Xylaria sp. CBS 124048]|nr:hypothetical protein GGR50DRAFT_521722 [Xylaria sp. CBS 124048]